MNKLEEMILYIAHRSQDDVSFGATKLNKILFIADFAAYGIWQESMTGATYKRLQNGPVPSELPNARKNLISKGRAKIVETEYFGRVQHRVIPLANPDLSIFTKQQINLVDNVIDDCKNL